MRHIMVYFHLVGEGEIIGDAGVYLDFQCPNAAAMSELVATALHTVYLYTPTMVGASFRQRRKELQRALDQVCPEQQRQFEVEDMSIEGTHDPTNRIDVLTSVTVACDTTEKLKKAAVSLMSAPPNTRQVLLFIPAEQATQLTGEATKAKHTPFGLMIIGLPWSANNRLLLVFLETFYRLNDAAGPDLGGGRWQSRHCSRCSACWCRQWCRTSATASKACTCPSSTTSWQPCS
jgi:hypothetical protein